MELKGKALGILAALILLVGTVFVITLNGGLGGIQMKNPIKQLDGHDLTPLYKDATFDFILPNMVVDGEFGDLISAETVAGTIVQIKMEHASFWATPFVDYNADPSGDYNTYAIDNRYINNDGSIYLRYRTNEVDKTLLLIKIQSVVYSIVMDEYYKEEDIVPKFGINISELDEFTGAPISEPVNDTNTEIEENQTINTNVSYTQYTNKNFGVQFMIPETEDKIEFIEINESDTVILSALCNDIVVFQIRKLETTEGVDSNEITTVLNSNWVLDNLGDTISNKTDSQKIIIANIDTIAGTFKEIT